MPESSEQARRAPIAWRANTKIQGPRASAIAQRIPAADPTRPRCGRTDLRGPDGREGAVGYRLGDPAGTDQQARDLSERQGLPGPGSARWIRLMRSSPSRNSSEASAAGARRRVRDGDAAGATIEPGTSAASPPRVPPDRPAVGRIERGPTDRVIGGPRARSGRGGDGASRRSHRADRPRPARRQERERNVDYEAAMKTVDLPEQEQSTAWGPARATPGRERLDGPGRDRLEGRSGTSEAVGPRCQGRSSRVRDDRTRCPDRADDCGSSGSRSGSCRRRRQTSDALSDIDRKESKYVEIIWLILMPQIFSGAVSRCRCCGVSSRLLAGVPMT